MKLKKKNLKTDHTLDSYSAILSPDTYEPPFIMPKPYVAWCHPCNKGFIKIDDLMIHWMEEHVKKQLKN
jgi:hypothetical protein